MEGTENRESLNPGKNLWQHNGQLRTLWRVLAFLALFLLVLLVLNIIAILYFPEVSGKVSYIVSALLAAFLATFFAQKGIEQTAFAGVGLQLRYALKDTASGTIFGGGLIVLATALLLATGAVSLQLSGPGFSGALLHFLDGLLFFAIVAAWEELVMRGYMFQTLLRRFGPYITLTVTSLLFSLMHVTNPHMSVISFGNILLAGIVMGSAYLATKTLWFPIGVHLGWNLVQGTVFGFPVSGIVGKSIWIGIDSGPAVLSGGAFGPEGGIAATLALMLGTALLWMPACKRMISGNRPASSDVNRSSTYEPMDKE